MKTRNRAQRAGFAVGAVLSAFTVDAAIINAGATELPAVEEVTVTARKRAERLADVPLSITVYRAADLEDLSYTTSPEIAAQTPNLMWNSVLGYSTPNIVLRGIGNATFNANQAGPVGVHVDGVYQGSSIAYGFGLMDLDRVEILKGPQGTLFGRNTTGGVINFISARPDPGQGFNARATATYGRFNEANLDGAVGFNVGDHAAVRVAAQTLTRDGYVVNRNPVSRIKNQGDLDIWASRVQFRYVADSLDLLFNVHGGQNHSDITPGKQIGAACPAGVVPTRIGQCSDFFGFVETQNLRESFANIPSFDHVDTWGGGATLTWAGNAFSVVSQTQYDANNRRLTNDSDVAPTSALKTNVTSDFHQFSQEVRALSDGGGAFTWIAGANYYADKLDAFQAFTLNAFGPRVISAPYETPGGPVSAVAEGLGAILHQKTESYAVFGEANYVVLPRLRLTMGGRWTHDRRSADTRASIFDATGFSTAFVTQAVADARAFQVTIPAMHLARAWGRWSGRGVLSYEVADSALVYGGVAHGFKGGDFNGGALFAPAEANIVNPEYVTSYELGLRGAALDNRVSLDVAGFYYDFTDQQVSVFVPGSSATLQRLANAGKTHVKGLEASISAMPIEPVFLQIKTGVLDAHYARFQLDLALPATNFAGNRTPSSPKFSLAGIVRYAVPIRGGRVSAQTDFTYTGAQFYSADNNRALRQDGYWLLNGHVRYETVDARYSLTAWMKNIADKAYFTAGLSNASFGFMEVFPGLPRTFGVTVAGKF